MLKKVYLHVNVDNTAQTKTSVNTAGPGKKVFVPTDIPISYHTSPKRSLEEVFNCIHDHDFINHIFYLTLT